MLALRQKNCMSLLVIKSFLRILALFILITVQEKIYFFIKFMIEFIPNQLFAK